MAETVAVMGTAVKATTVMQALTLDPRERDQVGFTNIKLGTYFTVIKTEIFYRSQMFRSVRFLDSQGTTWS